MRLNNSCFVWVTRKGRIIMRRICTVVIFLSAVFADVGFAEFSTCRFNFGMAWQGSSYNYPNEIDYVTIWAGSDENWNDYWIGDMLRACRPGGRLDGKTPVFYSYIIAFTARRDWGLGDCDVSGSNNLCDRGANFIRQEWPRITGQYEKYASNAARVYGTSQPIIWLMEPDYYQYSYSSQQGGGLSASELAQKMSELVSIVKRHLPNAKISLDISPWTPDQRAWFSAFDMSDFSFMNTSGGRTDANSIYIRNENRTTWRSIYDITGKGIIADDGYGVGGGNTGHDDTWDDVNNLNARIADGVIAITQADPKADWGSTIARIRPQLNTPLTCGSTPPPPSEYNLEVDVNGSGTVSKSPNQTVYASGTVVTLTAQPASGYEFSGWGGDLGGSSNPATITMNGNKSVTANFTQSGVTPPPSPPGDNMIVNGSFSDGNTSWNLGVYGTARASGRVSSGEYVTTIDTRGSDSWNVQLTQGGVFLESGKTYTLSFKARAEAPRTVIANIGQSSSPWTSYMGEFEVNLTTSMQLFTKTFTMTRTSDPNARVEFNSGLSAVDWFLDDVELVEGSGSTPPPSYSVDVSVSGNGSVSKSPDRSSYESGTSVSLTATPASGYVFSGWEGDLRGSANPASVTVDSDKSIRAIFTAQTQTYSLDVNTSGRGNVSKSPDASAYDEGTEVTLTASPRNGYVFSSWSGDLSGSVNPVTVTMNSDKNITATFVRQTNETYSLSISTTGEGNVSKSPDASVYDEGTEVTLTASPLNGYIFSGWSGDLSGTQSPVTITIDSDKSITATFTQGTGGGSPGGRNMIVNGDFQSGTDSWHLGAYNGAWANGSVVDGQYNTVISSRGSEDWHVQLTQGNLLIEQGKTYTLTFDARAQSNRTIRVNVGMSSSPWTSYMGAFEVQLTPTMQTFTRNFTMEQPTDANGRVEFNSGLSAVNWYLDQVELEENIDGSDDNSDYMIQSFALQASMLNDDRIRFKLHGADYETYNMKIYDRAGRLVYDSFGTKNYGMALQTWNCRNNRGNPVASGAYIAVVQTHLRNGTKKTYTKVLNITR